MEKKLPKFTVIDPTKDFVDSWRLLKSSIDNEKWEYPSLSQTHEEDVRKYLYGYEIINPAFFGMIARIGKKPIGQIIGDIQFKPIGQPQTFFFIFNFWIEPEYRKQGYMKAFWALFMEELKKKGVFHWEANGNKNVTAFLTEYKGYETKVLYPRIGGRI